MTRQDEVGELLARELLAAEVEALTHEGDGRAEMIRTFERGNLSLLQLAAILAIGKALNSSPSFDAGVEEAAKAKSLQRNVANKIREAAHRKHTRTGQCEWICALKDEEFQFISRVAISAVKAALSSNGDSGRAL